MSPTSLITVVIVAYNSADDLEELLPMLADERLEVIALDNDSPDDGRAVMASHPWCTGVEMGFNAGWTAACNEGARRAHSPVLAFLNPDVRVTPDELVELAGHLRPGVASASPTFVGRDGLPQSFAFRFPDPVMGLFVFLEAGRRIDRWLGSPFLSRRTYRGKQDVTDPDHVGAACLVVDRSVFASSNGFDERMWLFFSDTDWALRLREQGLRSVRVPSVEVVHEGGGSVGHLPAREMAVLFQRDYLSYARKHYSRSGRLVTFVGVVVLVGILPALAALFRGRPRQAWSCLGQARAVLS